MQTSSSLNEQFTRNSDDTDNHSGEQSTVIGHGNRSKHFREPPQGGIVASIYFILFPNILLLRVFIYRTFLLIQIHVIYPIAVALPHILYLPLLIITRLSLFVQHLLMSCRLSFHLYLPIFLLNESIRLHRSLLVLLFLISILLITIRNPHIPILFQVTAFIPRPSHSHPHITLIKMLVIYIRLLLLLFLSLLPLFSLFQRLYLL